MSEYDNRLQDALSFINGGDDYLVVSHVQPDGDAVSSTAAVFWLLSKLGKRAVLINESPIPQKFAFLAGAETIVHYREQPPQRKFKRIIAVDCADFRRIGDVAALFEEQYELLNIDHHPTNDRYGTVNVVRPDAAATVEILYDLIQHAAVPLDLEAATAIYTGLLTDTGGFRYSNTSPQVMEVAANLLALGVSGHQLADHLLERMTVAQLKLLRLGLNRLQFSGDNKICWLYIEPADMKEIGAVPEDLEGLVNYALNIEGVEVGILFKATDNGEVKASLRSAGKADVAAIAQLFGGGGHTRASGCRLAAPLAEAMPKVVEAVGKALTS
ncbi:DHH family phosphoesterase [Paenibacillus beijingensis]|uniref:DHH family phosphoesterase n=1 Tax=Paenibacillus beijingensis TaxID=1126833 RepID=UPI003B75BD00